MKNLDVDVQDVKIVFFIGSDVRENMKSICYFSQGMRGISSYLHPSMISKR